MVFFALSDWLLKLGIASAPRLGKYPLIFTFTSVNNCKIYFIIVPIMMNNNHLFQFEFSFQLNSLYIFFPQVIVASLVGNQMKEVHINLSLPLKFLDIQLRQIFRLKPWSFLALYLPGEQRNIFHVGRMIYTSYEEEFAKVLISNGKRNFPKPDKGIETLSIKEMYKECSVFKKSLRSLGFRPGTFVEVFEITGPSIPVMYSGAVTQAEVIDVNPDWSLQTFLYYAKVNTPQASKIESIDYVRDCNEGKVADVLYMMKNLWNGPKEGGRLEYLRLRS